MSVHVQRSQHVSNLAEGILTWILGTVQLCKAEQHQMGEEHMKHFYFYTRNWNFYFMLYLGQAQEKQVYLTCNVLD